MKNKILSFLFLSSYLLPVLIQAQTAAITVEGDIAKPVIFTTADLNTMNRINLKLADMDGGSHVYSGIAVTDILKKAGVIKPGFNRDDLTKYVLAKSSDNYEVLFSFTELDSAFSGRTILLVDSVDGKPLPQSKGPYRMAVPGEEKRQARWIWSVTTFIIKLSMD